MASIQTDTAKGDAEAEHLERRGWRDLKKNEGEVQKKKENKG